MKLPGKIIRGVMRRTVRLKRSIILYAPPIDTIPPSPEGLTFFHTDKTADAFMREQMEISMQAMDEPAGLVGKRLEDGDKFFGWQEHDRIVSFGWITYKDRLLGTTRYKDMPGRVFLYNFATLENYRSRGLYSGLLLRIRHVLAHEGATEILLEVDSKNGSSLKGVERAGFVSVAQLFLLIIFTKWKFLLKIIITNKAVKDLF